MAGYYKKDDFCPRLLCRAYVVLLRGVPAALSAQAPIKICTNGLDDGDALVPLPTAAAAHRALSMIFFLSRLVFEKRVLPLRSDFSY